jgi:hypothetical protein
MPANCACQWATCSAYSKAFAEDNHILAGCYNIIYSHRNMIEKHLFVSDSDVEQKITYRVAHHHWPGKLIMKNKNESRKINVLVY